jgi:PAS domain S-box-containing protein
MHFVTTPYLWPSLLAVAVALAVAFYAGLHRRAPGALAFAALMLATAWWSACYLLELSGADVATKSWWAGLKYFGVVTVPLAWFVFALQYAQRGREATPRNVVLLAVIPAFTAILAVTNAQHNWLWQFHELIPVDGYFMAKVDFEPLFYVHGIYSYALVFSGTALLAAALLRWPQVYRGQIVVLMLAMAVPFAANLLAVFGLSPVPYLDLTSFASVLSGLVLTIAVVRFRLFDLAPMARDTVIEEMQDGMIVLNARQRIADCNPAAARMLNVSPQRLIGQSIDEVLRARGRADLIDQFHDVAEVQIELQLNERDYELRLSPLVDRQRQAGGRLIVLRDVTDRRSALSALRQSEAKLSGIINTAQDAIITLDADQRIVLFNAAAERLFGCKASEVMGQTIDRFIPDRFRARHSDQIRLFGEAGITTRTMRAGSVTALRANGETFLTEASISRVMIDDHTFFTVILRDITERVKAEEDLRTQKQLFESLVAVARATTAKPDLEDTLRNVLTVGVSLTAAARGSLFLVDADGVVTHTVSVRENAPLEERRAVIGRVMSQGLVGWIVRYRQAALIRDTHDDDRWLSLSEEPNSARSALAVPIMSSQTLLGALMLLHPEPRHFTPEHLRMMQAAADQMALAVRNARSFEVQRRMAERQTTLYEILRTVGGKLDRDAVARTAAEAISLLTGWPHVAVILPDDGYQNWVVRAVSGSLTLTIGLSYPLDQGIIGRSFTTGKLQNVPDTRADRDFSFPDSATRSELVIPMRRGERVLGVLSIDSPQVSAFDADDVSLARSLADAVALALDNARLYRAIADERSRLQALIKSSRDGIVLMSLDQRLLVINEPALRLLGLPGRPEDWLDRSAVDLLRQLRRHVPHVVKVTAKEMRRIKTGDEPPAQGEYEVPPYAIRWTNLPVLSGTAAVGRLIVLRDVTEEHLLASMRDDLTNTMVHDLRNPLTVIQGSLDLLESSDTGQVAPAQQQVLDVMRTGVERMLSLVTAILDVNRLESGQMPLEREPVAMHHLAHDMLAAQSVLAIEKRLQLTCAVPAALPPVSVDVELMRRILQNLIGNAIKFTPPGGTVTIDAQLDSDDPDMMIVMIADTGPGLPAEVEARLFQKFVTGRGHERGSGLGLAFCRLAIEAHGGRIWAERGSPSGTTFKLTLPVVR